MSAIRSHHTIRLRVFVIDLLAAVLTAGCATSPVAPALPEPEAHTEPLPSVWIPVVRYGRYTLVELTPDADQHDLLLQVFDVSMPPTLPAMVGDALRYAAALGLSPLRERCRGRCALRTSAARRPSSA